MPQSISPSFSFQAPPGWVPSISTTPRQLSDGPILPVELMSMVIKELTDNHSLGTLAKLQSTSRAMYNMVTPALYQHITIDQYQAVKLFGLFETFPRSDNSIFLQSTPTDPSVHLIDLHIAHRLRFAFSNTRTLSLKTTRSNSPDPEDIGERLARYKELRLGPGASKSPTLWPRIERCEWVLRPWKEQYILPVIRPREDQDLVESIFKGLHPNQLDVTLPQPWLFRNYDLSSSVAGLQANHINIFNFTACSPGSIPRASSSTTIHFLRVDWGAISHWRDKDIALLNSWTMTSFTSPVDAFADIDELKLVGVLSTLPQFPINFVQTQKEVLDDLEYFLVDEFLDFRLEHGNRHALKITVQPSIEPEGVAGAESRIYTLPRR